MDILGKQQKTANFALSVSVVSDQMSGFLAKLKYERKWINGIMKWISCGIGGISDIRDKNKTASSIDAIAYCPIAIITWDCLIFYDFE